MAQFNDPANSPNNSNAGRRSAESTTRQRKSPLAWLFLFIIRGYQTLLSPLLGPRCRFMPTCSQYSIEAVQKHGAIRGGWLTVTRLSRCHPVHVLGGGCGCDPVPTSLQKRWWLGRQNVVPESSQK